MIIGRFYFRRTTSGNLIGEYSNNTSENNLTESADLLERPEGATLFEGKYRSSWSDPTRPLQATLTITRKENFVNIFNLHWVWHEGGDAFWGEGMIVDGLLIGDYRDKRNIPTR